MDVSVEIIPFFLLYNQVSVLFVNLFRAYILCLFAEYGYFFTLAIKELSQQNRLKAEKNGSNNLGKLKKKMEQMNIKKLAIKTWNILHSWKNFLQYYMV